MTESVFSPIALAFILFSGLMICLVSRRKAVSPFLIAGILIPFDQIIVVGGLHFQMLRVLLLFGYARIIWAKLSGEKILSGGINGIDKALIILTLITAVNGILLWRAGGEIIFQLGNVFTVFGVYLLLRYLIQTWEDARQALRAMTSVCLIIAALMVYEHATGHNLIYALLGGSRASMENALTRANDVRAAGPFAHPIIAGTFGGFMVPLFVGWWKREKTDRLYAGIGALGATIIPFMVGSSTALFALLAGTGALCLWPMRRRLRTLRWGVVGILIAAQLYMTSPVWHLISDVSLSADSSSYHRYELVNQCILHFWDWALIGTKNYGLWGWDMWDLANQYVQTADQSGLISLIAFLAILVTGFRYIGKARQHYEGDYENEVLIWAVGACLFANAVGFFGIGYWDQVIVAWYMVLAIVTAVTLPARVGVAAATVVPIPTNQPQVSFADSPSPSLRIAGKERERARMQLQTGRQLGRFDAH